MLQEKENKDYFFSSFKGIYREENQDSLVVIDEPCYSLFAVFDGVGGARNGKAASEFAKRFIKDNYSTYVSEIIKVDELMYNLNKRLTRSGIYEAYILFLC